MIHGPWKGPFQQLWQRISIGLGLDRFELGADPGINIFQLGVFGREGWLHSASEQTRGNSFAEIGKPWTHALVRRLLCRLEEKSSIPSWQAVQSIGAPPLFLGRHRGRVPPQVQVSVHLGQDKAPFRTQQLRVAAAAAVQQPNPALWELGIPVLVVCCGMQLLDDPSDLFTNVEDGSTMWMSHGDSVQALPEGFMRLAHTDNTPEAVVADHERRLYGGLISP